MTRLSAGKGRRLAAVAALLALALACAPAAGAAGNPALADCIAHGRLTRSYSTATLRNALRTMSPTTRQYSSCQDVINQALVAGLGRSHPRPPAGGGGGASGSFLPTPVIVVLAVLVAGALAMGAIAVRRSQGLPGKPGPHEGG